MVVAGSQQIPVVDKRLVSVGPTLKGDSSQQIVCVGETGEGKKGFKERYSGYQLQWARCWGKWLRGRVWGMLSLRCLLHI